ncbi:RNA polymerase sigma-70 factor [Pedobacter nyackensis]|uniref:RNA polymerase sigma-70 factor, ECF subfamily n=1 Tax=Pedobacter nyackensis TaxID=475255 RepID=A0A1W2CQV1_9SPHI|nr:RNA polymerase sigma-70 factor [Pedobacter nyackensis]SMC87334.1 RNA polymerase sigma-70 factor, ECF subfamily [Pedobacter nyackensis]
MFTQAILMDEALLSLLESDDESGLKLIYDQYWEQLYLAAFSILRDADPCKDIVQDVLLQLWVRRAEVKIDSLKSYLFTAVRYKVLTYIKSANNRKVFIEDGELERLAGFDLMKDRLNEQDVEKLLEQGVALLPKRCQEVFLLSRMEFLSNKEIASRMGISVKTVEAQMSIALKQLRIVMGEVLFLACVSSLFLN